MANLENISKLNSFGFSVYSAFQVLSKTELFLRYDKLFYDVPGDLPTGKQNDGNTIMGGVSHSPVKGINISLNYQGWLPDESAIPNENSILLSMEYNF